MPLLTVKEGGRTLSLTCGVGSSLRQVLERADAGGLSGCDGGGSCGLCRITILAGEAHPPGASERALLNAHELSKGTRLACQLKVTGDLKIEILFPRPPSEWRCLGEACRTPVGNSPVGPLAVAVDLGTTNICLSLIDSSNALRLAGRQSPNPQAGAGADIVTRLIAARDGSKAERLSRLVLEAIGAGVGELAAAQGLDPGRVGRVAIVGNSAMLALLSGVNAELLLKPGSSPRETAAWGAYREIAPGAPIEIIPPLAGFVGSDLLAGVVATRLTEKGRGALLVDFGTNSELALWDGERLWITSAAGGPAFEGSGIGCGIPAESGAIWRVTPSSKGGALDCETIGACLPRGVCGSGLVDLLSCLVQNGSLDKKGRFAAGVNGIPFCSANGDLILTKKDVDLFQRAKAAIGAAAEALVAEAGMTLREVRCILVAGVFGRHLDMKNAQSLGLLPQIDGEVVPCGNTALAGCEAFLAGGEGIFEEVRGKVVPLDLARSPEFDRLFLEHLYLAPRGTE